MSYNEHDRVRVQKGPFREFTGTVQEIDFGATTLRILINVFGRDTLIDLRFDEVEKFV